MSELLDYVVTHVVRGPCMCGQCIDTPKACQPQGHTIDLVFFEVAAFDHPDKDTLKALIAKHKGEFVQINPLDGNEYSYIHLGAWIGSQDIALRLAALGKLVGLWELYTPYYLADNPADMPKGVALAAAQQGLIIIKTKPEEIVGAVCKPISFCCKKEQKP